MTSGSAWVDRGATLLELAVAVALVGVLLAGLLLVWAQGIKVYLQGSETADLQQEARIAHQRMMNEIRLAGVQPCGGILTGAVTQAASGNLTIQYFSPGDTINCSPDPTTLQTVKYAYDSINRQVTRQLSPTATPPGAVKPLTGSTIGTLTFRYFNCTGTELVPPGDLDTQPKRDNIVRMTVTVSASETYSGESVALVRQLASAVRLRGKNTCAGVLF